MNNDMEYSIGISLKSALRDIKKFKKIADDFNKKLAKDQKAGRKIESDNTKHLVSEKKKQGKASKSLLADMLRDEEKLARAKERQLDKEKAQQKQFNTWRKAQNRKLVDSTLTAHQKKEIKRVLASKKSAEAIREEYDETLRKFRKNKRLETQAAKKAHKEKLNAEKNHSKRMSKIRGGVVGLAQTAIGVATGGAAMVFGGGQQYGEDRANASAAGMSIGDFQRQAYQVTQSTNITSEKFADITKTANERKGSTQFLEKGKDGEFKGADAGATDFINAVQQKLGKDLNLSDAQNLLNQGGKTGIEGLMEMRDQMDALGLTIEQQSFLMESYASDAWNLTEQYKRNAKAAKQAEADFKRLGLGIQNLEAVNRVTNEFSRMWGTLKQAPIEAFESFSSALSPETSATLQKVTERLVEFSRVIGEKFAVGLNRLAPLIEKLFPLFEALTPLFTFVTGALGLQIEMAGNIFSTVVDTLTGTVKAIKQIVNGEFSEAFNTIKDTFKNLFLSLGNAITDAVKGMIGIVVDFLPDMLTPDWMKDFSNSSSQPSVMAPTSTAAPKIKPQATIPPKATNGNGSNGAVNVQSHSNVTIQLEGEQLARVVASSPLMRESVNRQINNTYQYNYQ